MRIFEESEVLGGVVGKFYEKCLGRRLKNYRGVLNCTLANDRSSYEFSLDNCTKVAGPM